MEQTWQPIDTAPHDGTPLILFARCKTATAPVVVIGHYFEREWLEMTFVPNRAIGIVPTHWMPRPPAQPKE